MHVDRLISFLLLLFLAVSCVEALDTPETAGGGLVPVQLALSFEKEEGPSTKAMVTTLKEMAETPVFRGMDSIWIVPFSVARNILSTDQPLYDARQLESISGTLDTAAFFGNGHYHSGLVQTSNAHFYPDATIALPDGTASVLVYGQAPRAAVTAQVTEPQVKHRYGSLINEGLSTLDGTLTAEAIRFRPDPISTVSSDNATASELAYILTSITNTSYTPASGTAVFWKTSTDPTLEAYFKAITYDGKEMPGAGLHVLRMVNDIYQALKGFTSEDPTSMGLKDAILQKYADLVTQRKLAYDSESDKYSFVESSVRNYPVSLGLPEGAALVRWDGQRFNPVKEQQFEALAPMNRFCYMPPICYFVNTTIKTSVSRDLYKKYTKENDWSQILSHYTLGTEVDEHTHAVALVDPLQFACSQCVLTVRAKTEQLPDRNGALCEATGENFPVVGILIASQFTQGFDFTAEPHTTEYTMYDNDFYADGVATSFLTYYDATAVTALPKLQTLVFPTPVAHDVYFCLEIRNDSGKSFIGAEGIVAPGTCFYLIGKLDLTNMPLNQVFIPDCYTTVSCVVETLENAHICAPELRTPQLELGVRTEINWIMAQPAQIPLR